MESSLNASKTQLDAVEIYCTQLHNVIVLRYGPDSLDSDRLDVDLIEYLENNKLFGPSLNDLKERVEQKFEEYAESKLQDRYANKVLRSYNTIWGYYKSIHNVKSKLASLRSIDRPTDQDEHNQEANEPIITWRGGSFLDIDYSQIITTPKQFRSDQYNEILGDKTRLGRKYNAVKLVLSWVWTVLDILRSSMEMFAPELFEANKELLYKLPFFDQTGYRYYWKSFESPKGLSTLTEQSVKLQWSCKPAVAGFIVSELIRAGYIEPPTTNCELSQSKLATICSQIFAFKHHTPTLSSWRNVIDPERNTLPDYKRSKLRLTDYQDLV